MKFDIGEIVVVLKSGELGEVKKIRPNQVQEYTVRIINGGELIRQSEYELKKYEFENHETVIELPPDTVIEVEGMQVYPKKRRQSFLDKMEFKGADNDG